MTTDAHLDSARAGDPVALARLLVSIPSVNPTLAPGGAGESAVASACAELLEHWGFATELREVAPGRANVIAELQGEGPRILFNGHLDTVGVDGMTIDPFGASVEGSRLLGRGSCDMKGGVAALMAAGRRLAERGPRPSLTVLLTADEEHASIGMADYVASAQASAFAIVCEPTSLRVMPAHKGFVWIRALFRGQAAHGSRPDVGVDAIRHAALYIAELEAHASELASREAHPLLGHGSFHAGTITGGSAESVYPDLCTLLLERRTLPGEEVSEVVHDFQVVLDALALKHAAFDADLAVTLDRPGTEVPVTNEHLVALLEASASAGADHAVEGMTAWVDAAFLNEAGTPTVCYGPGSIEQAHTADEWVEIGEIRLCADALEGFARGLVR